MGARRGLQWMTDAKFGRPALFLTSRPFSACFPFNFSLDFYRHLPTHVWGVRGSRWKLTGAKFGHHPPFFWHLEHFWFCFPYNFPLSIFRLPPTHVWGVRGRRRKRNLANPAYVSAIYALFALFFFIISMFPSPVRTCVGRPRRMTGADGVKIRTTLPFF